MKDFKKESSVLLILLAGLAHAVNIPIYRTDNELYSKYVCRNKPDNTQLIVPGNCKQYYVCVNGQAITHNCPKSYDPIKGCCTDDENECCGKLDGYVVSFSNPAIYFKCSNGVKTWKGECTDGKEYNLAELRCDIPSRCETCTSVTTTCSTPTTTCTTPTTTCTTPTTTCTTPTTTCTTPTTTCTTPTTTRTTPTTTCTTPTTTRTTPTTTCTTPTTTCTTPTTTCTTPTTTCTTPTTTCTMPTTTYTTPTTTCTTPTTTCTTPTTTCTTPTTTCSTPTTSCTPPTTTCSTPTTPCTAPTTPCPAITTPCPTTPHISAVSKGVPFSKYLTDKVNVYPNQANFLRPDAFCWNKPDGSYVRVHQSCSKYFFCWNNKGLLMNCGRLHFNVRTNSCVEPSKSDCRLQ